MADQPTPLDLGTARPARGGLIEAADPLPSGWERGVEFASTLCIGPFTVPNPCPASASADKTASEPGTAGPFHPFFVGAAAACDTRSGLDLAGLTNGVTDATREYAVAREFATGAQTGNPSLSDVTSDVGDATDAAEALACLEDDAAQALSGRGVFVHASPAAAAVLLGARVIWRDGIRWRTAAGSTVVVSSGYAGVANPGAGTSSPIWATGQVWAAIGARDTFESIDRSLNVADSRTEDLALAVSDPCYVGVAGTGLAC